MRKTPEKMAEEMRGSLIREDVVSIVKAAYAEAERAEGEPRPVADLIDAAISALVYCGAEESSDKLRTAQRANDMGSLGAALRSAKWELSFERSAREQDGRDLMHVDRAMAALGRLWAGIPAGAPAPSGAREAMEKLVSDPRAPLRFERIIRVGAKCALAALPYAEPDERAILGRRCDAMIAWTHGRAGLQMVDDAFTDRTPRLTTPANNAARSAVNAVRCAMAVQELDHLVRVVVNVLVAAGRDDRSLDLLLTGLILAIDD